MYRFHLLWKGDLVLEISNAIEITGAVQAIIFPAKSQPKYDVYELTIKSFRIVTLIKTHLWPQTA